MSQIVLLFVGRSGNCSRPKHLSILGIFFVKERWKLKRWGGRSAKGLAVPDVLVKGLDVALLGSMPMHETLISTCSFRKAPSTSVPHYRVNQTFLALPAQPVVPPLIATVRLGECGRVSVQADPMPTTSRTMIQSTKKSTNASGTVSVVQCRTTHWTSCLMNFHRMVGANCKISHPPSTKMNWMHNSINRSKISLKNGRKPLGISLRLPLMAILMHSWRWTGCVVVPGLLIHMT